MMSEVEKIAASLTKASRRALARFSADGVMSERGGSAGRDAYSLWWGRDGGKGITEPPDLMESGSWTWHLTPLGIAVRQHLQDTTS